MEQKNNFSLQTTWVEDLALEELNMEETGVVNFTGYLNPEALLEESSIDFMNILKDFFEIFVSKFNFHRGENQPGSAIKIFKISGTINDFMLFRNSLKLIVARKSPDIITIALLSSTSSPYLGKKDPLSHSGTGQMTHDLKAYIGPFNEITWRYQGELANPQMIVKHYLTEFIKLSAK